jgi:hypothetical protein
LLHNAGGSWFRTVVAELMELAILEGVSGYLAENEGGVEE